MLQSAEIMRFGRTFGRRSGARSSSRGASPEGAMRCAGLNATHLGVNRPMSDARHPNLTR